MQRRISSYKNQQHCFQCIIYLFIVNVFVFIVLYYYMWVIFEGENISRMPSGAIIHEENFHECMALNNIATCTLNSA